MPICCFPLTVLQKIYFFNYIMIIFSWLSNKKWKSKLCDGWRTKLWWMNYNLWLKYELLSYLIFFISSCGNWFNVKKIEGGFCIVFFCLHILHITNLMKVWNWSFKQKYLLIRDDNVVVTLANQKFACKFWSENYYAFETLCKCRNTFLGKLADFILIIFMYLSTVSFATGNIIKLLFSWGDEVYITLPYQIYSSCLRDYMANYIWNMNVFPNVIKN